MISTFLKQFFSQLSKSNIKYAVLRNYTGLPESLNGSDLDILIEGNDINKFYDSLSSILIATNGRVIIKYGQLTPRLCICGAKNMESFGVQLDVHEGILPYKTSVMFPVEFLLGRSNKFNDISVANDEDADLLSFFKEILNNGKCKEGHFNNAKIAWNKNKTLYTNALLDIYSVNFIDALSMVFKKPFENESIFKLSLMGRKELTKGRASLGRNIKSNLSRIYRFFKPPGFTIAVLGTDGAGKTTIIEELRQPLNEAVHNEFFYEHMRPNLLPSIAQLFGRGATNGVVTNPHASSTSGFIGSLSRLLYYSIDYIFGYWFKVYPIMVKKSSIWVFDRYYYDYLIDPKRGRIKLPRWIINGIRILLPEPNIILCLGTAPELIHIRKPELSLEEVNLQVNKLKSFCKSEKNAFWIDTGVSIEQSRHEALDIIIKKMAERYN
jgi:thymidylate kinase